MRTLVGRPIGRHIGKIIGRPICKLTGRPIGKHRADLKVRNDDDSF